MSPRRSLVLARKSLVRAIVLFVLFVLLLNFSVPYDTTDDTTNKTRSGLSLYTDHLTGCQYLRAGIFGGITPRLTANGKHQGCRE